MSPRLANERLQVVKESIAFEEDPQAICTDIETCKEDDGRGVEDKLL